MTTKQARRPYEYRAEEFIKLLQAAGNGITHKGGLCTGYFTMNTGITSAPGVSRVLRKMEENQIITRETSGHRTMAITLTPAFRKGDLNPTDLYSAIRYRRKAKPSKARPTAKDRDAAKILEDLIKRLDIAQRPKPSPSMTAHIAVLEKEIEERDRLIKVLKERVETTMAQKEALRKNIEQYRQRNGRGSFALEDLLSEDEKNALHSLLSS